MKNHRLRSSLLLPLLLLACDGSGSGSGKGPTLPGSTQDAADFCTSFTRAAVDMLTGCYGGGQTFWNDLYTRVMNCGEMAQRVAAGTLVYDANQARQCLDTVKTLDCGNDGPIASCNAAVTGTVPAGGACSAETLQFFSDCAPGNDCDPNTDACGGTCRPQARIGAPCGYALGTDDWVDCESGSSCDYETEVCLADATEGQACAASGGTDCASGLYCEAGSTSTSGVCRKEKTSGSCASNTECAGNYWCSNSGAAAGTCQRMKLPGDACVPGECMPFFTWCGNDGKCTDTPAAENQPCGSADGNYIPCATGLACAYSTTTSAGTCKKLTPAGGACAFSSECAGAGAYCDSATQLCVACS